MTAASVDSLTALPSCSPTTRVESARDREHDNAAVRGGTDEARSRRAALIAISKVSRSPVRMYLRRSPMVASLPYLRFLPPSSLLPSSAAPRSSQRAAASAALQRRRFSTGDFDSQRPVAQHPRPARPLRPPPAPRAARPVFKKWVVNTKRFSQPASDPFMDRGVYSNESAVPRDQSPRCAPCERRVAQVASVGSFAKLEKKFGGRRRRANRITKCGRLLRNLEVCEI